MNALGGKKLILRLCGPNDADSAKVLRSNGIGR